MKVKPELKILEEINKRLERVELIQYLIVSALIPRCKPTPEEKKIINEALKSKEWANEEELFKVLRK